MLERPIDPRTTPKRGKSFFLWIVLLIVPATLVLAGCDSQSPAPTESESSTSSGASGTEEGLAKDFIEGNRSVADMPPDKVTAAARGFFVQWLEAHGEKDVINDETGVGISAAETRLWAFLYGSNETKNGIFIVQLEFRIVLPGGREIQEFVAANGNTQDDAINRCFENFTLSTFHTVYACFMNPEDDHVLREEIEINGRKMKYTTSGIMAFMGSDSIEFTGVSDQIREMVKSANVEHRVSWLKFVYGQARGEAVSPSALMNNEPFPVLTEQLPKLDWPTTESFYMAKQFVVLEPVEEK